MASSSQSMAEDESSRKQLEEAINRILLCGICRNIVTYPRQLGQCLHSFCKGCVDRLVPSRDEGAIEAVKCTICDVFSAMSDIEPDEFLQQLLKLYNIILVPCDKCNRNEADAHWKCLSCQCNICNDCKEMHEDNSNMNQHRIEKLCVTELQDNPPVIDEFLLCDKHPNSPLAFYCKTCKEVICIKCVENDHSLHATELVEATLERALRKLKLFAEKIDQRVSCRQKQLKTLQEKMTETRKCYIAKKRELVAIFDMLESNPATMTDVLDELVRNLSMEEMDALEELRTCKRRIEYKQKLDRNLVDLFKVCEVKTRNVSQFNCLRGKLYQRMGEKANAIETCTKFTLEESKFKAWPFHSAEVHITLSRIFFMTKYDLKLYLNGSIEKCQQVISQESYMCKKFEEVLDKTLKLEKKYALESNWCQYRLSSINNDIWVTLPLLKSAETCYDDLDRSFLIDLAGYSYNVIKQMLSKYYIAAGYKGLYYADYGPPSDGRVKFKRLIQGTFCDIAIFGEEFAAVSCDDCATIYRLKRSQSLDWKICGVLELEFIKSDLFSTLAVLQQADSIQYVVASGNKRSIHICSEEGICLKKWQCAGTPLLCGVDSQGDVLVASYGSGELWLLNKDAPSTTFDSEHLLMKKKFHINSPGSLCDVLIDKSNSVWCLVDVAGSETKHCKLLKFSIDS